ncbi:MAG TPA: serine/threonine-protein kinase, partial [Blastocatellia bacterium]|nr:serine/threonine-protein kinase [Blastocatellia bacterium]
MTPERHRQINEICHAMMQLPSSQRTAFLARACGHDDALRHEVESLLAYEEQAATFIEKPALEVLAKDLAQAQPRTGQHISHFQILAPLGKGGMGEVYLAQDQRLGRKVAIKLLLPEFTANKTFVERFDQEACAASALNHPNIITVYEIDETNDLHFIATELVEGQTLRQLMNNQPLEPKMALEIALQIASALQAAHSAGIVHRDIKPENVMIRSDGLVKVLDFGLAKLTENRRGDRATERWSEDESTLALSPARPLAHSPLTIPGAVMGTVAYMSPEQARGQAVDHRTDLFSLGVVLYEMLAGYPPFTGSTPMDVIARILQQEPPPIPNQTLQESVARALCKEREDRYSSAAEMLRDLTRCKEKLSAVIAPSEVSAPVARFQWLVAAALLTLALVVFFVWRSRRSDLPPAPEIKSLAVLPLKSLTHEEEETSLGLGIADTIITKVSRINGLIVRPTSAVRRYTRQEQDALQAAREQRVDAVLDGTMQRAGDRLRVSVNLLRTRDGASLWAEQFDLGFTEIFALQDKVAQQVVERLQYQVSAAEQARIAKQQTTNPQAYEYYVKAAYYFGDRKMFWWQRELTDKAVALL